MSRFMTTAEAAEALNVSSATLRRYVRRGLVTPLRTPGGAPRYTNELLDEIVRPKPGPKPKIAA